MINWLLHRHCRQAYSIVYKWYEEERDRATALQVANIELQETLNAVRNERDAAREALREAQALGRQAALDEITHAGLQLEIQKHEQPPKPARRKKTMEVPPA